MKIRSMMKNVFELFIIPNIESFINIVLVFLSDSNYLNFNFTAIYRIHP